MEVVHGKLNKQFDVILYDIFNKDIIFPTPLLPLHIVHNGKFYVFGTCSYTIPSYEDLQSLLRTCLHDRKEVRYDTSVCFDVEKTLGKVP